MISATAAVFAVLVLVLTGGLSALSAHSPTGPASHQSGLRAASIPATSLEVNRSQIVAPGSGGSNVYQPEYVTLNNSTTLTKLPAVVTVKSATDCRWVTVANLTTTESAFISVVYVNATAANASGTLLTPAATEPKGTLVYPPNVDVQSFKACGGAAEWVNFYQVQYSIFNFGSPTLGSPATVQLVYVTPSGQAKQTLNANYTAPAKGTLQFKVPASAAFQIVYPATVTGPTTCDVTGQVCSYNLYTFTTATGAQGATVNSSYTQTTYTFKAAQSIGGDYYNWTLTWTNASVSNDPSALGSFIVSPLEMLAHDLETPWVVVVLVFLAAGAIAFAVGRDGKRNRRSRR